MLSVLGRALLNLLRLPFLPLWLFGRLVGRPRGEWIVVKLRPRLTEVERPGSFLLRMVPELSRALPTPLEALRRLADHAVADPGVKGIVLFIPPLQSGWAACTGVREIVARLREAGKEVVAFLPRGGGNREIYVASAADRVYISPQATIMALGLSLEARYFRPLLDKIGISAEAYGRGEYKTAAEALIRESMSEPQREQLGALLATLDRVLVRALAERPELDEEKARALLARGLLRGEAAVAAGLADGACYEDDLPIAVTREHDRKRRRPFVRASRYLAFHEGRFFLRLVRAPYIAVIEVRGVIAEQAPALGPRAIDLDHIVAALRHARDDGRVKGVVLLVSSPGGSGLASDLIHREVERLKEKKPVVAYFEDVAASGGYYVAASAHAIVAQPTTVTGSIGVISVKLVARALLDRIGIRTEVIRTSPHADMFSVGRSLEPEEREMLAREIDAFYDAFVDVVAAGRGRPREEVEPLARGRVWSGADAHERGLVDRLGGLDAALDEVRIRTSLGAGARAALRPRLYRVRRTDVPPPPPAAEAAAAAVALAGIAIAPELADLAALASGRDRVLYYAPGLPRID